MRSIVDESTADVVVGIDSAVAQERPLRSKSVEVAVVEVGNDQLLLVDRRARDDASVWRCNEALSPELDSGRPVRRRLESHAIYRGDEATVGDGVRALRHLPGLPLRL